MSEGGATTGSIARAARVLDALAAAPEGATLSELVARTALTKTTAHRVLTSLAGIRYVVQDPESRGWRLGHRLGEIARAADRIDLAAFACRGMGRLAAETEDTVFLSVPEGAASVCVARKVGAYPIRTLTLDRGDRRPLGVGAGALALWCAMPAARRAVVNRVNRAWLAEDGMTEAALNAARLRYEETGHALNPGLVVPAMSAVGVPVVTRGGRLVAALAVGAIDERMGEARRAGVILPALHREAERLGARLSEMEAAA
jgi:DNA-binding IclR family transcriptional regulator